jgi:replicative DNA helicase
MPDEISKIPPQNLEAEQSLLGSLLIDKDAFLKIADIIDPEDFYRDSHKTIFEQMRKLYSNQEPIDFLTLGNQLEENKLLEKVGGRAYLTQLSNIVPTSSHVVHYAKIIRKKSTRRRLLNAAAEITEVGYDEEQEVDKLLDIAEQKLFSVSQKHLKKSFVPIDEILNEAFDRIDDIHKGEGKLRGMPTGFGDLDNLLGGLQKSDLVILAARPSVGKTSMAMDIARQAAINSKIPVGLFSLEMSKEQLVDRLLCAEANVDLWKMRTGKLSDREEDDDFPRIGHAMGILSEAPIFIDDSAMCNVIDIRTKARRLQAEHGLGLIVIDYLQLMESRAGAESRVQAVAEITRALKGIARELDIPVLALSQLSRAVEMTKPAIPKLSHLRESGSIEQDADVVMFIYRKSVDRNYQAEQIPVEQKNIAEIHVAKHRNGPTGLVKLFFQEQTASFKNLSKEVKGLAPPPH